MSSQNITIYINNVYKERELVKEATCKDFLQVQKEGGRTIQRKVKHYNLDVIISVGYRVKSQRGVQFRQWANRVLKDYLLKGYAVNEKIRRSQIGELRQQARLLPRLQGSHRNVAKGMGGTAKTHGLTFFD